MQSITTSTFSINIPAIYEHTQTVWESVLAEQKQNDERLSYVTIGLQELSFFNDYYTGDDLLARFKEFCLEERGAVEVIEDKTLPVAGLTATVRTAKSQQGEFYYFGLAPISSEYGYLFIGDCALDARATYEPLFDEIWQSLQYYGDPAAAVRKRDTALEARFSNTTDAEIEDKPIEPFTIPADGKEYWQIGEHFFSMHNEELCSISDGDGALYVTIKAQAPSAIDAEQSDLINDYEDGKVYLQFYFKGIYKAGIPTGKFSFKDERDATYLSYCWKGGFNYQQSLTAVVTLQDGWLGINGYFNEYPVKLAIKLPVDQLPWENYRFLSIDEVNTAPSDIVRHLWLTDAYAGILQETLQPLTRLQVLSIDYRDSKQAADFTALPNAVKRMKELKELSLTGVSALDSLPQWLGDLKELESLRLTNSKVEGIHPYIFQLPLLKNLYLSNNQLQSIHPALPEKLDTLIVDNNKLTTVPASVTRLRYLNIEDNPLQQLPAGIESVHRLTLELEKKIALLDYEYKGADGRGTIVYDDSRFYVKHDPVLVQVLEEQIDAAALADFKEGLINRARKSVAFATTEEDTYEQKGEHRFGGLPDLPPGAAYPSFIDRDEQEKGFQFIAQINCAAVAHLQDYLPRTGMLYFYVNDLEDLQPLVIYFNGDNSTLQSAGTLNIEPDYIYDQNGIYTPFKAEAGKYPGTPSMYNASSLYPELAAMEELWDETEKLEAGLKASAINPVHSINSYVFKQHDTPEIEAVDKKRGKPDEWMVLLRVSSDYNPGFQFWDAGELYFVIHKSDLEKKDFSNVYCGLESS